MNKRQEKKITQTGSPAPILKVCSTAKTEERSNQHPICPDTQSALDYRKKRGCQPASIPVCVLVKLSLEFGLLHSYKYFFNRVSHQNSSAASGYEHRQKIPARLYLMRRPAVAVSLVPKFSHVRVCVYVCACDCALQQEFVCVNVCVFHNFYPMRACVAALICSCVYVGVFYNS